MQITHANDKITTLETTTASGEFREVKFYDDGQIRIETKTEDGWLDINLEPNGKIHVYDERDETPNSEGGFTQAVTFVEELAEIIYNQ
jgi:hypothetical protein